jgi:hypothetical protein
VPDHTSPELGQSILLQEADGEQITRSLTQTFDSAMNKSEPLA